MYPVCCSRAEPDNSLYACMCCMVAGCSGGSLDVPAYANMLVSCSDVETGMLACCSMLLSLIHISEPTRPLYIS